VNAGYLTFKATDESKPTPSPLVIRPKTIVQNPTVTVWIAPPMVNIMAPANSVPFRPMISPTRPAATEVTISGIEAVSA